MEKSNLFVRWGGGWFAMKVSDNEDITPIERDKQVRPKKSEAERKTFC